MKQIIFLLTMTMMTPVILFSQIDPIGNSDTINKMDPNKAKYGYWIEKIGDQIVKGYYVNNKKTGVWITTLSSNLIQRLEYYKDGVKDGISLSIDRKGHLMSQEYFKNGLLNGLSINYTAFSEMQVSEINYLNGKKNGIYRTYYDNGKLQEETNYIEDIKDGQSKWYNKAGKRVAEYNYGNGAFQGIQKTYYDNDTLSTATTYLNNIMTGDYKEYYRNGKLKQEGKYINGLKEGAWVEYDELGKPLKTVKF